ncbi:hypothetical protein [Roseicyclus persicicus]|uniref:Uncharacterized protein n=1 Tax=Roseicyclus persicicus TaxID=2650661 RepID=A0A7X6JYN0_9RHOB|nr:hypothetical protein [Roseibacterium persicicum]NKX44275.1 hypothetical protein [Roseibacterium persicicum]
MVNAPSARLRARPCRAGTAGLSFRQHGPAAVWSDLTGDGQLAEQAILHIGMHKTGSSTIQGALARAGAGPGWRYVWQGSPNGSFWVKAVLDGEAGGHHTLPFPPAEARARFIEAFRLVAERRAIFSGETMSTLSAPRVATIVEILQAADLAVAAIGYVRPIQSYIDSSFQQRLKGGRVALADAVRPKAIAYDQRFGVWDAALGQAAVTLVPFERQRFPGGSVLGDIAARLSLGPIQDPASHANTGLSAEAVRLLWIWRQRQPRKGQGDEHRIRLLQTLEGPGFVLANRVVDPFRATIRAQAEWVERRTGWRMPTDPPEDQPHAVGAEADFLTLAPDTLDWLGAQTGVAPAQMKDDPDAVAAAMAVLGRQPPGQGASALGKASRALGARIWPWSRSGRRV